MITNKLREIEILNIDQVRETLTQYSDKQLEALYCECVELKHEFKTAYNRLLDEITKRNETR